MLSKTHSQTIGKALLFIGKSYVYLTSLFIGGLFVFAGFSTWPAITASGLFCLTIGSIILYCVINPFGLN
jgi:hypothetical protein